MCITNFIILTERVKMKVAFPEERHVTIYFSRETSKKGLDGKFYCCKHASLQST